MESVDEEAPDLEALCRTPLTMGEEREGWLRFVLGLAENPLRKDIEALTLIVKDIYGQEHPIYCPKSEWHKNKDTQLITKYEVEIEQQRVKDSGLSNLL